MKTKTLKIFLVFTFLLIDFVSFANPAEDDESNNLNGDDPVAAPINGKLIWLAILGIAFAYYSFKKKRLLESVK